MIITKCNATDYENNFDDIEHEITGSGFYPICQDYKEKN